MGGAIGAEFIEERKQSDLRRRCDFPAGWQPLKTVCTAIIDYRGTTPGKTFDSANYSEVQRCRVMMPNGEDYEQWMRYTELGDSL